MRITKYGENVVYVNFRNQSESERTSQTKAEEEVLAQRENLKSDSLLQLTSETQREIIEYISVVSGTVQSMEHMIKTDQEMREEDICKVERICNNTRGALDKIGKIICLMEKHSSTM